MIKIPTARVQTDFSALFYQTSVTSLLLIDMLMLLPVYRLSSRMNKCSVTSFCMLTLISDCYECVHFRTYFFVSIL
uniref:Uncharacterized protein n=1 Tax=Anguilla anguilla TaxID=7936 RepID=A0A0E9WZG4_ANGAN